MAVRETTTVLTAGEYLAICTAVVDDTIEFTDEETNTDQERAVIRFRFALDGEQAGIQDTEAIAWTPKFNELSKAGQFAKELMGWTKLPAGTWDDEQLIGQACYVRMVEKEGKNKQKYINLDSIRSVPKSLRDHENIRGQVRELRDYAGLDAEKPGEENGRKAGEPDLDDAEANDIPF